MAVLFLCASAAGAPEDINGKWHAQVPWPGRNLTDFYFVFKVDGAKLTGTVTYAVGDSLARMDIIEGKVSGADLSFAVISTQRNTEQKWTFKGKAEGTTIPFTAEMPPMPPMAPPAAGAPGAPGAAPAAAPPAAAPAPPAGAAPATPTVLSFTAKRGAS
jgi:hypothetical protein